MVISNALGVWSCAVTLLFSACNFENWEWPGDEATWLQDMFLCIYTTHCCQAFPRLHEKCRMAWLGSRTQVENLTMVWHHMMSQPLLQLQLNTLHKPLPELGSTGMLGMHKPQVPWDWCGYIRLSFRSGRQVVILGRTTMWRIFGRPCHSMA